MDRAYTICMIVGIGIPLISLLLGSIFDFFDGLFDGISNLFDGLDLNFDLSLDVGDTHICFLPFSLQSICAGLLLYGTVGKLIYSGGDGSIVIANVAGAAAGYVAAAAMQTLIYRLKRVDHSPVDQDDLLFCDSVVTNTIIPGGFGKVTIRTEEGVNLSYPAKAYAPEEEIRQNTEVNIIRFDDNVAIVKKAGVSGKPLEFGK